MFCHVSCPRRCLALLRNWPLLLLLLPGSAAAAEKLKAEIVPQVGHSDWVNSVAFSPDGRTAASAGHDQMVKLWDVASGNLVRTIKAHERWVLGVAFSPDGRALVSRGFLDDTLKFWDPVTGQLLRKLETVETGLSSMALSPDGRLLAIGTGSGIIELRDFATTKLLRSFSAGRSSLNFVKSVAFSPDGRTILSGDKEGKAVKLWDVATGKMIRKFEGHTDGVELVAFSPDGRTALTSGDSFDGTTRIWDVATGALRHTIEKKTTASIAFAPDGKTAVLVNTFTLNKWNMETGKLLNKLGEDANSVTITPDGRLLMSGGTNSKPAVKLWDAAGKPLRTFGSGGSDTQTIAIASDGRTVYSGGSDKSIRVWDRATGKLLRSLKSPSGYYFSGQLEEVRSVALSPDNRKVLVNGRISKLIDAETGERLHFFKGSESDARSVAFSPDGRIAIFDDYRTLKLWDAETGTLLRTLNNGEDITHSVAFSPNGRTIVSGGDKMVKLWDAGTGTLLRAIRVIPANFASIMDGVYSVAFAPDGRAVLSAAGVVSSQADTLKLWNAATGNLMRTFEAGGRPPVAFSPDGRAAISGGSNQTLKLWDVATGKVRRTFSGHGSSVSAVAFSPDGRTVMSGSGDGTMRFWSTSGGNELIRLMTSKDGDWLAMTPAGFFDFRGSSEQFLSIVRGLELTSLEQTYRSLYNPDLVREALAGDPDGEVKRAGDVINLDKVIESGPAPVVEIVTPEAGKTITTDIVTATARITDRGKGIGRIEWRVNGVTAAVTSSPPGKGPDYVISQQLALDRGGKLDRTENTIELVAYNASNLLASLPARITITVFATDGEKPKLHVLAIGINAYVDKGSIAQGAKTKTAFGPLSLAVKDAATLAAALKQAGAQQYAEVKVTEALDTNATAAGLQQAIERMAQEIHPRDTFVLFAAAHGTSHNGRFYLIPQDYSGGMDPTALQERAIGQDRLQDWVANKIKAKKVLILLDTCESGALVGGTSRSRTDVPTSEAALGRLHEATGRPVLTAAAEGKPAFEGFEGHGVFTWALLDALKNGDRNSNSTIELSELVAHVQDQVPKIAATLNGRGRAAIATRGASSDRQSARFGSRGEDFSLVQRLQ